MIGKRFGDIIMLFRRNTIIKLGLFLLIFVLLGLYFYPVLKLGCGIIESRCFRDHSNLLFSLINDPVPNVIKNSVIGFLVSLLTAGTFANLSHGNRTDKIYVVLLVLVVVLVLIAQVINLEVIKVQKLYVEEFYSSEGFESLLSLSTMLIQETILILGLMFGITIEAWTPLKDWITGSNGTVAL